MTVTYNGFTYNVPATVSIGSLSFQPAKALEWTDSHILSPEGELSRLYLEIFGHPEYNVTDPVNGGTITIPAVRGVDLETASFAALNTWLNDGTILKSESARQLCRKVMAIRFPSDFNDEISKVDPSLEDEYNLIKTETKSIDTLGQCGGGVFGEVRLDGTTKQR